MRRHKKFGAKALISPNTNIVRLAPIKTYQNNTNIEHCTCKGYAYVHNQCSDVLRLRRVVVTQKNEAGGCATLFGATLLGSKTIYVQKPF